MKNVDITFPDGETKQIELKGLNSKMMKELLNKQLAVPKAKTTDDQASCTFAYIQALDEACAKISGIDIETLDELDIEEKKKIQNYIRNHVQSLVGF